MTMAYPGVMLHWHADAMATMELISNTFDKTETWVKSMTIFIAAVWLSYRIYQVITKPVNELVDLLGLEVPDAPTVSLASIKADGALLGWKSPDPSTSVSKYHI